MSAVSLGVVLLIACCMVCRITCQDYGDRALRNNGRVENEQLCEENVCFNGGTCYWKTQGYSCQCPTAFTGRKCLIRKARPALRAPIGARLVRTDEGVVVICKDSNYTILPVRDAHGRWTYGTGRIYCPKVNPRMWNRNRTDNVSNPKENDTMSRFNLGRKNGFEQHIQMLVERAMFKVMGSVDRRMQRFMAKVNQRIEVLEQRWSSDEQRDVDDIDVSDVESDPEEDFDSEGIDEETVKLIRMKIRLLRKLGFRVTCGSNPSTTTQETEEVQICNVCPPEAADFGGSHSKDSYFTIKKQHDTV